MKLYSIPCLALLIYCSQSFSQTIVQKANTGTWAFIDYAPNIIKATFTPTGYITTENITAAVIKPPFQKQTIPTKIVNQQAIIGNNQQVTITPSFTIEGYHGFSINLLQNEKIFGGGERALPLNRRGYAFNLYNNPWYGYSNGADNLNFSVPFFTSNNGYGLFFDNGSKGVVDIGKTNNEIMQVGFVSGELNVFIIFGDSYAQILQGFHSLTGKQPLPPRWVLGNFMSRFGYSSKQQVTEIAAAMQSNQIPVDAIIYDLFWFGDSIKGTLGNLDWVNTAKWPSPKKMIHTFNQQQIKSILIAEPFVLKGTKNFTAAEQYLATDSAKKPFMLQDFYFGVGGVFDIFRKDAADWIWKNHYQKQLANGATGWWTDLGEPEKHPSNLYHSLTTTKYTRLFGADEVHNVFGHYWNKMLSEKYATYLPNQRLFHLNRSGFAGSQRFSIFPWSGDVSRSWDGLNAQLNIMLGMSMSGIPYIHADAGGFAGGQGDKELYVRWLQFAAFTPIFRPHGTALGAIDPNAFSFASEPALIDEPYRTYCKQVIQLRYSLLPYNYTLAYKQATQAAPLVAPLYYYYQNDTTAVNIGNQFMWGENILVAPVLQKGITQQKIYLPNGNWYKMGKSVQNLNNNTIYTGWNTIPLAIDEMPVFVKAGSFLPTIIKQPGLNTSAYTTDSLVVHYFASNQTSTYTLYDDDGISKNAIAAKQFETITFTALPSSKNIVFTITSNGGKYIGKPNKRMITLIFHGDVNNKKCTSSNTNIINTITNQLPTCSLIFTGKPITIQLK